MKVFCCPICGANKLEKRADNVYRCVHCDGMFRDEIAEEQKATILEIFGEEIAKAKEEQIAKIRGNLWLATHEKYTDSDKILKYARDLKNLLPDDFQANFYEVANSEDVRGICDFIDDIDVEQYACYLPEVTAFLIKSLEPIMVCSVKTLIKRAFKDKEYVRYISTVEEEALKLDEGVYTASLPRDVFLAYSSLDETKVNKVCTLLEREGLSCFTSFRNLRHGRGSVKNYQKELETAIKSCKCFVFISTENSRSLSCDALKLEIPFAKATCPDMGRVEYVVEEYGKKTTVAAKTVLKGFFDGLEWCRTEEDLIVRVVEAVTKVPSSQGDNDEVRRLMLEQQEKLKQLETQINSNIVAEQRAKEEAEKRAEAERKAREEEAKRRVKEQDNQKRIEDAEKRAKEEAARRAQAEERRTEREQAAAERRVRREHNLTIAQIERRAKAQARAEVRRFEREARRGERYNRSVRSSYEDDDKKKKYIFIALSIVVIFAALIIGQVWQYNKFKQTGEINILSKVVDLSKESNLLWFLIMSTCFNVAIAIVAAFALFGMRRLDTSLYVWGSIVSVFFVLYLILAPCFIGTILFALIVLVLVVMQVLHWFGVIDMEDIMNGLIGAIFTDED